MKQNDKIVLFQESQIRRIWHENEWYFVINDVILGLTDSKDPKQYFNKLRKRDTELERGVQIVHPLSIETSQGKQTMNCATTKGILRIIQSVPSPKAEPFKRWMAEVGQQTLDEIENPELGFDRLREIYKAKGYPDEWIERRMQSIETRKQLTDEWKNRDVKEGQEYALLTAQIAKGTFGLTPTEHKEVKGLTKPTQNLRDHMTPLELIFTALGEEATRQVTLRDNAVGFNENYDAAKEGGEAAGEARDRLEKRLGQKVVSDKNYLNQEEKSKEIE
jgi:DNA-damage-inducible protein D